MEFPTSRTAWCEDEDTPVLQNTSDCLTGDTVWCTRKPEYSIIPVCEKLVSPLLCYFLHLIAVKCWHTTNILDLTYWGLMNLQLDSFTGNTTAKCWCSFGVSEIAFFFVWLIMRFWFRWLWSCIRTLFNGR